MRRERAKKSAGVYPCVCCGHLMAAEPPGSDDICSICFWQDDMVQLRWPTTGGGANKVSLIQGQENYREFGSCELRLIPHVRPPQDDEIIEAGWRPIDEERDRFESWAPGPKLDWPEDLTTLYWWRPTFWRPLG